MVKAEVVFENEEDYEYFLEAIDVAVEEGEFEGDVQVKKIEEGE